MKVTIGTYVLELSNQETEKVIHDFLKFTNCRSELREIAKREGVLESIDMILFGILKLKQRGD